MEKLKFTYLAKGQYWRFRRAGLDLDLGGNPLDCPTARARYDELVAQTNKVRAEAPKVDSTSVRWLVEKFEASVEFKGRSANTRLCYSQSFRTVVEALGDVPYRLVTKRMVKGLRDKVAERTPRNAQLLQVAVRVLFDWAEECELVEEDSNPCLNLKKLKHKGEQVEGWTEEEIALFFKHCAPHVRTPVLLALYTGQRCSDIASMDWTQYQGGIVRVRQQKTKTLLSIGCHRMLREHLEKVDVRVGRIVRNAKGKPMSSRALGDAVRDALRKIPGFPPDRSIHGLRYAAAGRLSQAGCSVAQITAVTGHAAYLIAMQYATQREDALAAVAMQEAYEDEKAAESA